MGKGVVKLGEGQWAVKDGNLLAAKETNGRFKNAEFTVARGTRATYVGRDGLIKESNLQDTNLVQNGDYEELGSELVTNGSLDTNSGWTFVNGPTYNSNGYIDFNLVSGNARTDISVVQDKVYKVVYEIKNYQEGTIKFRFQGGTNTIGQQQSGNGIKTEYVTCNDSSNDNIQFFGSSSFIGSVDNVSVKQVDPNDRWTLSSTFEIDNGKLHCVSDGSYQYAYQGSVFVVGKTYKITFDILDYTSGSIRVRPSGQSGYTAFSANGTYTQYFTATDTTLAIERDSACNLYIDNVSVQEVKTDTPRIDFTDNTDGHLLLEPQSTNLITYSENFSHVNGWSAIDGASVDPNYAISPRGTQDAWKFNYDGTTNGRVEILAQSGITPSQSVTFSVWLKTLSGTKEVIIGHSSWGLQLLTVTNEWQRFTYTVTATTNFGYPRVRMDSEGSILVWGYQLEQLPYATSYIPTNGSTVTRDAETCTGAGEAADFNSEEGVLYAEIAALANDGTFRMIAISDGTENNSINLYYRNSYDRITARLRSGGSQEIFESFNITATNFSKVAFRYKSGESNLFIDGIKQKASDYTTTNMPSGLSELAFDGGGGTNFFYGKCKAIRVYKEALSDTDLQNLTS